MICWYCVISSGAWWLTRYRGGSRYSSVGSIITSSGSETVFPRLFFFIILDLFWFRLERVRVSKKCTRNLEVRGQKNKKTKNSTWKCMIAKVLLTRLHGEGGEEDYEIWKRTPLEGDWKKYLWQEEAWFEINEGRRWGRRENQVSTWGGQRVTWVMRPKMTWGRGMRENDD